WTVRAAQGESRIGVEGSRGQFVAGLIVNRNFDGQRGDVERFGSDLRPEKIWNAHAGAAINLKVQAGPEAGIDDAFNGNLALGRGNLRGEAGFDIFNRLPAARDHDAGPERGRKFGQRPVRFQRGPRGRGPLVARTEGPTRI